MVTNTTTSHHPTAPVIITGLAILILVGSYLVLADYHGWWPYHSAFIDISGQPIYRNEQYGFQIELPESWRDFTIITDHREVYNVASGDIHSSIPTIAIRHPLWTPDIPRQDIPIDIYAPEQWEGVNSGQYSVGAAPIPPSELARNSQYVFALPARYNYAFPTGFEEVQSIIDSGAVISFTP